MNDELHELVTELEDAAAQLRSGELSPEDAAQTVERCAELANRAGQELEREARATPGGEQPGQETLL